VDSDEELAIGERIRTRKARYFRLMDSKRWPEFSELFLEDSRFDASKAMADPADEGIEPDEQTEEPLVGRAAILAYVSGGLNDSTRSFHEGFMPEITVHSPTAASAIWAMEDRVWFREGPVERMHGYGHYHETYTKKGEQWYIQTLEITRIKVDLTHR